MLLVHEVCHSSKIYLLIDGLKLENGEGMMIDKG